MIDHKWYIWCYSYSGSRSRSRSRSYERRGRRGRDRSRSPLSSRRRHRGNRDDPDPNRCVGVFGLSLDTRERDVEVCNLVLLYKICFLAYAMYMYVHVYAILAWPADFILYNACSFVLGVFWKPLHWVISMNCSLPHSLCNISQHDLSFDKIKFVCQI